MDPDATLDLIEDALEHGNELIAAEHTKNLVEWIWKGGRVPTFPAGRREGCPWWVVYLEHWDRAGDGELLATQDEGRGDYIRLLPTDVGARILFDEPDALGGFVFHVDNHGFVHCYGVTIEEANQLRREWTPKED